MLERQIIKTKTARTPIQSIDAEAERDALKSPLIQDRIENTASILAERVWLPLCERWWKRFPAIPQERPKSVKSIAPPADERRHPPAALQPRIQQQALGCGGQTARLLAWC